MRSPGSFRSIPLTTKVILLTIFVGFVSWGVLEQVHNRRLRTIFEVQLNMQLEAHAQEARVRFDDYIKSYRDAAEITVSQSRFDIYLNTKDLKNAGDVKYHDEVPPWLPGRSVLRRLVRVSFASLMDGEGNVREIYQGIPGPLPPSLLKPGPLLRAMSSNQSFMTKVDGLPFVLTARPVPGKDGSTKVILMFASALDNDFLADSQGFAGGKRIVVLISEDRIIACNRPDVLPSGAPLDETRRKYLMMGKSFFDTGSSDLLMEFTSLIPKTEYKALGEEVLSTGRRNRLLLTLTFIVIFSIVMSRITRRIEDLTKRISDFSKHNLGGISRGIDMGDQLDILDMSFQRLTEEVISATAKLGKARDELESRVEERTAELKESENKFRDLAERSLVGIYLIQDGLFRYVNPEFAALFGYTVEELTGRMGPADLSSQDWPVVEKQLQRRLEGQTDSVHYVFRGTRKNLEPVDVEVYGSKTTYHGEPAIIGTLIDITERKKAEEEIKGLFSTLQTLVEHMPEGVLLLDEKDRIVLVNPVGARYIEVLSGTAKGGVLKHIGGRPIRDLLVSPPLIMWHDLTTEKGAYEIAGRKIDSRGMVFAIREVTEERLLKERVQLHERLAAVGQVSAGVAHDFNNILTVMSGYAEMLLEKDLPPDMKREVEAIHQGGERASVLINQILDFSRKTVGELRPLEMAAFVEGFISFIKSTIPENISIKFRHLPREYIVNADRTKMEQVLANLTVNARDVMPEGGELIFEIGVLSINPGGKGPLPEMPGGDWVMLKVEDTGTGISPEELPHIFEPFFTTKAGRGTGLGLSQVYGIVRQHNGFTDVKTEVGKGSTFTIYLPAISEAVGLLSDEKAAAVPRGQGETILIVEDEESVLGYLRTALSNLGYKLISAENGALALKLFEAHESEIRLIVTDMVMPEMGGARLAIEIHRRNPGVRVIALSAYSPVTDGEFQEAGFNNFIKKPFKIHELANAVREALDKPV